MNEHQVDLIITRSASVVEWCRRQGIRAPVLPQAVPGTIRGRRVLGNLPLHLAQHCAAVLVIEFAGDAPRVNDCSADDMDSAGAAIVEYVVSGPLDSSGADRHGWAARMAWVGERELSFAWEREWMRYSAAQSDFGWFARHLSQLEAAALLYADQPYELVEVLPAITNPPDARGSGQITRILNETAAEWPPTPPTPVEVRR
jgi:hypothetical protein